MTPRTVTVALDADLVARFRAARAARMAASARSDALDTPETASEFKRALRAEEEAAVWLALHVDNQAGGRS